MMAKVVVVAEVAEMMVVMMMMVLLATTHLIMTPLMMIPLKEPTCLMRKHDSYALWKPFSVIPQTSLQYIPYILSFNHLHTATLTFVTCALLHL